MSTISIALCVYNGARFLREQLDSLMAQTRPPDELVVCDDCSTDSTVSIVKGFAREAPFDVNLRVNNSILGSCKNFEQAINLCSGDMIALCDQDDVWLPDKLAVSEELLLADPGIGLVFGDAELVDENLRPLGKTLWDYTFPVADRKRFKNDLALQVLSRENVVTGATVTFRSCYRKAFFPFPDLAGLIHDYWIALVIASHSKISFLTKPLIKYRQHAEQQIGLPSYLKCGPSYAKTIDLIQSTLQRIDELKEGARKGQFTLSEGTNSWRRDNPGVLLYDALKVHEMHLRERCAHYEARRRLSQNRLLRVPVVLRELSSGRYLRHSRGLLSAIKDCVW